MVTRAQKLITLREQYENDACALKARRQFSSEREKQQTYERIETLERVVGDLAPIAAQMQPSRLQALIEGVLDWLAADKAMWIVKNIRERAAQGSKQPDLWLAEGAIEHIDAIVLGLCSQLSPQWNASSPKRHGLYFHVYHSLDLSTMIDEEVGKRYWLSTERERWFKEVAIVKVSQAEGQLDQVFRLTNHIDHPWQENPEVVWYLRTPPAPFFRMGNVTVVPARNWQARVPRSTSVGDVIVSLLSGVAWIVAAAGFRVIALDDVRAESS